MAHHAATALSYAFIVYVTSSDSAEKHDRVAAVMPHHVLEWSGQNIYALLLHTRTPRRRTYTAHSHMVPCMCWSIAHRASTAHRPTPLLLAQRCHQHTARGFLASNDEHASGHQRPRPRLRGTSALCWHIGTRAVMRHRCCTSACVVCIVSFDRRRKTAPSHVT